jgi:acyl carrier protein
MDPHSLRRQLKNLVVTSARLPVAPDEIEDDEPLFGGRFGLDSLDALQLAVGLEEQFGVQVPDDAEGRACFRTIATLSDYVMEHARGGEGRDAVGPGDGLAEAGGLAE